MPLPELSDEKRAWYILKGYEIKVDSYGDRWFKSNGNSHREDGPAREFENGDKTWYLNGKLHREDGLAIDWFNVQAWYLYGKAMSEEEHKKAVTEMNNATS